MSPSRKATGNRIELVGRLVQEPELRTTPGGLDVLRLLVDCGGDGGPMRLSVIMSGEEARKLRPLLKSGSQVTAAGTIRALRVGVTRPGSGTEIEVVAERIELNQ